MYEEIAGIWWNRYLILYTVARQRDVVRGRSGLTSLFSFVVGTVGLLH